MTHITKRRDWASLRCDFARQKCERRGAPSCRVSDDGIENWCLPCALAEMGYRLIEIDGEPVEPIQTKIGDVIEAGKTYRLESGRVKLREEWIDGSWCLDDGEETESK